MAAEQFFEQNAAAAIDAICEFFQKKNPGGGHDLFVPKNLGQKVVKALTEVDAHFRSGVFKKVDPRIDETRILTKASTALPSVLISG